MFTPLMLAGIGELIFALLLLAFVVACFCLMLVGLCALVALPLMLILPLFGKKVKWDKEYLLVCLLFIPIGFFLGMLGIELLKIFGQWFLDIVNRFPIMGGILISIIACAILFTVVSNIITHQLSKASRELTKQIRQANSDCNFSHRDTLKEKQNHIESDIKKRKELSLLISYAVVSVLFAIYYVIFQT